MKFSLSRALIFMPVFFHTHLRQQAGNERAMHLLISRRLFINRKTQFPHRLPTLCVNVLPLSQPHKMNKLARHLLAKLIT